MNAMNLHGLSEYYANSAQVSQNCNDYLIAAWLEENAVDALAQYHPVPIRTLGIFAVSAAVMYLKSGRSQYSRNLALAYLGMPNIPEFAKTALLELVN
jgi:hypothetical protein